MTLSAKLSTCGAAGRKRRCKACQGHAAASLAIDHSVRSDSAHYQHQQRSHRRKRAPNATDIPAPIAEKHLGVPLQRGQAMRLVFNDRDLDAPFHTQTPSPSSSSTVFSRNCFRSAFPQPTAPTPSASRSSGFCRQVSSN